MVRAAAKHTTHGAGRSSTVMADCRCCLSTCCRVSVSRDDSVVESRASCAVLVRGEMGDRVGTMGAAGGMGRARLPPSAPSRSAPTGRGGRTTSSDASCGAPPAAAAAAGTAMGESVAPKGWATATGTRGGGRGRRGAVPGGGRGRRGAVPGGGAAPSAPAAGGSVGTWMGSGLRELSEPPKRLRRESSRDKPSRVRAGDWSDSNGCGERLRDGSGARLGWYAGLSGPSDRWEAVSEGTTELLCAVRLQHARAARSALRQPRRHIGAAGRGPGGLRAEAGAGRGQARHRTLRVVSPWDLNARRGGSTSAATPDLLITSAVAGVGRFQENCWRVSVCVTKRSGRCPSPPPHLNGNHLRATASSHPWSNIPKVTPPPSPEGTKRTRDTGQNMQTQGHMGALSHSARTAPIVMLFIPGTPLKTTHLQKHARSIHNSMGCGIQDPGTRGKHHSDKKSLVYQQGL